MRIIHLSDFHLDKNKTNLLRTKSNVESLVSTLRQINEEKEIDLILFTGDAINKGGDSYDSISNSFRAFKIIFVERILKELDLSIDRFFFTIGNHDINRNEDSKYTEKGILLDLTSVEKVNEFYDNQTSSEGIGRVVPFKIFEQSFYGKSFQKENIRQTNFESCYKINIKGKTVGISCLNTAWRCWDSKKDQGKILLGIRQLENSKLFLDNCDIKIALSHHHYNWMAYFEVNEIEKLLVSTFDLYFCGHTHSPNSEYCVKPEGKTFKFVASGILSSNIFNNQQQYKNGFSIIDYDLDEGKVRSSRYFQNSTKFSIDNSRENAIWEVDIPLGEEAKKKLAIQNVIINIKEETDCLNEHLLSYKTPTSAPKSLSDIFVMPHLTTRKEIDDKLVGFRDAKDDQEEDIKDLSDLIFSNDNYILFGIKESGKTILLDKILLDILNSCKSDKPIPVTLSFDRIKEDISANIRDYWHKNRIEVEQIIENDNILLLIDNFVFSEEHVNKIKTLKSFLDAHKNIRFIGTCLEQRNDELIVNSTSQSMLNFNRVEIKQFKTSQIRELVKKWFPKLPVTYKAVDTLISAFCSLNLPRTPFTISMFLWIIERQESSRPQNHALLIENFIEELLCTKDPKGSLRETFDYKNKIRLLASLAHEMYDKDNLNYYLEYSDLIKKTEDYLGKRKFKTFYNANKIVREFIELSIFVEEGSSVRFRFLCFFEYFLAKEMEFNSQFKDFVLQEDNYLKFCNEITYFTGINRGEKALLSMIVDRLEYNYIEINDFVFSRVNSIDDFFNVNESLMQKIKADELFKLLPDKKTEEDSNQESDKMLEVKSDEEQEIISKKKSNKFTDYSSLLLLAMNVLKNSEEVDEGNLKYDSYVKILRHSISYTLLYKLICEEMISHADSFPKERIADLSFILRFLPVLHQTLISENMCTFKLSEVVKDKINQDKAEDGMQNSEFEQYLSVFLYADMQASEYKVILSNFMSSFNRAYIADASFFKIISYYRDSTDKKYDHTLLNILGDLYIKMNANNNRNKHINKSSIMKKFAIDKDLEILKD